jgi:NADH-quinone oxidoreductase subunit M
MAFLSHWLMTVLLLVPAAGAATVVVLGRAAATRWIALGAMFLAFVISLVSLIPLRWRQAASGPGPSGPQLIPHIDLRYEAGIDDLSFPLVVMTTALFPLLCLISWEAAARQAKWLAKLLCLEFCVLAGFVLLSFPLMLAAMAGVIGVSMLLLREGGAGRAMGISLGVGLCLQLVPVIGIARTGGGMVGHQALFVGATVGFLFWMAIVPFHRWMMGVISRGSTPGAIAVAVLAPALGAYGIVRVAGMLGPLPGTVWMPFAGLGVASVLYAGLIAMTRLKIEEFVANAVTVAMGFVLLGLSVRAPVARGGAMILVLSQVLVVGLLLYARDVTAEQSTSLSGIAWLGWLVAPTTLGQIVVVLGAFQAGRTAPAVYGLAIAASAGVLLSAAGAARLIYRLRFPPAPEL